MQAQKPLIILDTETGGLDPLENSILSVGLVSGDGEHEFEVFICEENMNCDPRALAVNGIDPEWIKANGLSPVDAVAKIEAWVDMVAPQRPAMAVGHNIAFDIGFMRRLYTLAGKRIPRDFAHRTVDTHTLIFGLKMRGLLPAHIKGSDDIFEHFDIAPPEDKRHTALGDAIATRVLLERLLELIAPA